MDYSYLVQLDEGKATAPEWINALRVGKFQHPLYGDIDVTPERLQRFADSVTMKVRGIDPDIDYDHKALGGKAAGWIKEAKIEDDRLFLKVDWTDPAKEAIKNNEYRYFSPEYQDEWTDAQGNVHKDVIFGGGLTNRPFLKDLAPLNFDDYYEQRDNPKGREESLSDSPQVSLNEGVKVDTIKLAEILGTKEEDEAKLLDEVKSLREYKEAQTAEADKAKQFAEMFPEIHAEKEADRKRLAELEKTNKLAETDRRLSEWVQKGLPPVVEEVGLREFRSDLSEDAAVKFDEIIAKVVEVGLVKLNDEQGGSRDPSDAAAADQFEGAIKKFMDEDKELSYFDAVKLAEQAEPELAKAYKASSR